MKWLRVESGTEVCGLCRIVCRTYVLRLREKPACKHLRLIAQCIVCEWFMRFFKMMANGSLRVAWMCP